eukprot:5967832-Alexandrium_andersonii.AAC.1
MAALGCLFRARLVRRRAARAWVKIAKPLAALDRELQQRMRRALVNLDEAITRSVAHKRRWRDRDMRRQRSSEWGWMNGENTAQAQR